MWSHSESREPAQAAFNAYTSNPLDGEVQLVEEKTHIEIGSHRYVSKPDFVLSGINHGPNMGEDVLYSGTVAAAMEGLSMGIPSIAVSYAGRLMRVDDSPLDQLVQPLASLLRHLTSLPAFPAHTLLNVNIPPVPAAEIKGVKLTRIGSWLSFGLAYSDDLGNFKPALAGKPGVGFRYAPAPAPSDVDSEGVWLQQGYVTVSPFTGLPATPTPTVGAALQPGFEAALTAAFANLVPATPAK